MNIHETYVSLEVAKLLKEAGFDWPTRYSYDLYLYSTEGEKRVIDGFASTFCNEHNGLTSMPTTEVAQKWLREEKHISVEVNHGYCFDCKTECLSAEDSAYILVWRFTISDLRMDVNDIFRDENETENLLNHPTYDEALELGIKKCLEIILKDK